ncbi:hypothetical protein BDA96_04G180800 [Sorghum bicolor]|uniref:Uncharacterized protein n=1 Tax=Sorghum bicolor TaxID=4558 RepID=A0A921UID8_SORBI|nr:hypothetical protein BDA96_04G180800 [Sorghum bicolor]
MYVLSSNSSYPSFRVLTFGGRRTYKSPLRRRSYKEKPWQWDSLSPPPFPRDFRISCHAVLDDGVTICVTATCYNYGDDVEEKSTLTSLAGPLLRGAPALCVRPTHAAAAAGEPQTLKHLGEVVEMPKGWESIKASLLNLGDGRFCIAQIIEDDWSGDDPLLVGTGGGVTMLALLTGVEMVRGGGGFKMVTHKSLSYIFGYDSIRWVL